MGRRTAAAAGAAGPRGEHPFLRHPHRTLLALSLPVLVSLVAEPLTGIADTAFVARLGATPLAALGAATALLSALFWVFNFLGVGTQTAVARSLGAGDGAGARRALATALATAAVLGAAVALIAWPWLGGLAELLGASGDMRAAAVSYLEVRVLAAPAVLATLAAFGALRGLHDMRTPLRIAVAINSLNVVLDAVLVLGLGPFPALGLRGAAWATAASQVLGALWAVAAARGAVGGGAPLRARAVRDLLVVGRELFLRTALLLFFLALATRAATRLGSDVGAAHQALRSVWMLTAFVLDAYATAAQSLVGSFVGAGAEPAARRVASVASLWAAGTGAVLALALWAGEGWARDLLVPVEAWGVLGGAWAVAAAAQPLSALSFVTDGIHWGAGDYRFLRNAMALATAAGALALALELPPGAAGLERIWQITAGWIAVRAGLGLVRIWPGIDMAPLGAARLSGPRPRRDAGPGRFRGGLE